MSQPDPSARRRDPLTGPLGTLPGWASVGLTFLGAFGLAGVLNALSPWILYAALIAATVMAVGIWILEADVSTARRLVRNPVGRVVLGAVSRLSGADLPGPPGPTLDAATFQRVEAAMKLAFPEQDETFGPMVRTLHARATLLARKGTVDRKEPLASLLMIGRQSLGKRSFAITFGDALFGAGGSAVIDMAAGPGAMGDVAAALRARPQRLLVLENLDRADHSVQESALELLKSGGLTSRKGWVDARGAILVFIVHQDSAELLRVIAEGSTIVIPTIARDANLPKELVSRLDGWIPVGLPGKDALIEVVEAMFVREAASAGLEVVVPYEVLAREMRSIQDNGDLSEAPGRVKRHAAPAIQQALASGAGAAKVSLAKGDQP